MDRFVDFSVCIWMTVNMVSILSFHQQILLASRGTQRQIRAPNGDRWSIFGQNTQIPIRDTLDVVTWVS